MMQRFLPHVTVAAIIEHDGRYLLVEEPDRITASAPSVFNQPAGHLEAGETLLAATRREAREESGWEIEVTGYLGLYINTAPNDITYHSHTFLARAERQVTNVLDSDIIAAHWFDFATIETLQRCGRLRSPLVALRLRDARNGHCWPLDMIHDLAGSDD